MSGLHPAFVERLRPDRLCCDGRLESACRELRRNDFVKFDNFFESSVFEELRDEVQRLLPLAMRRDFVMDGFGTPRKMEVVGGRTIFANSQKLAALFFAYPVVSFLSTVVGAALHLNRQTDAFMTINHLTRDGDTQGWHLDDGSHTIVYVFSAPDPSEGGALQYISDWSGILGSLPKDREAPVAEGVQRARQEGRLRSVPLQDNSMYVLKADTSLHRVEPLRSPSTDRTVLAAGYEVQPVAAYGHSGADLYRDS